MRKEHQQYTFGLVPLRLPVRLRLGLVRDGPVLLFSGLKRSSPVAWSRPVRKGEHVAEQGPLHGPRHTGRQAETDVDSLFPFGRRKMSV